VTANGRGPLFEDASSEPAGQLGLGDTPADLWPVEAVRIRQGRDVKLRSYSDYPEMAGYPRIAEFNQITGNVKVREELRRLYGHVDDIELYGGLFAEEAQKNSVVPALIGRMVALDAFSQVYTSPLLAPGIFNETTFTAGHGHHPPHQDALAARQTATCPNAREGISWA
jgi:prostaglandin-endoperoxide synthase 2